MRSKAWAQTWSVMRLAMAALIIAAVVAQLAKSLSTAAELGRDVGTTLANFFSFFTILSNSLAAAVLIWAALWFFTRGRHSNAEPPALALALACVTTYMIITGVVYNLLLRQIVLTGGGGIFLPGSTGFLDGCGEHSAWPPGGASPLVAVVPPGLGGLNLTLWLAYVTWPGTGFCPLSSISAPAPFRIP